MRGLVATVLYSLLLATGADDRPALHYANVGYIEPADSHFLDSLLHTQPARFDSILAHADELEIQIIYTQIDRDSENRPHFTEHTWHLNPGRYFNPASLVKLPTAVAALEKLHQYEAQGVTLATPMATGAAHKCQTAVLNPFSRDPDRVASVGNYIRRMLLVSDNEAYNRLYEFVGPADLRRAFARWGMPDSRIVTRFSPRCDSISNRYTNPITFLPLDREPVRQPAAFDSAAPALPGPRLYKGTAWQNGKRLIKAPFDFTQANRLSLADINTLLRAILFPETAPQLNLRPADRAFLRQYLGLTPHAARFSQYRTPGYYDAYKKYLYYGRNPRRPVPEPGGPRSFNIVGLSYGFVADCSYLVEPTSGIELMLSAVLYVNRDGILNDARYEYSTTAWPFLADLGQLLFEYEKKRSRTNRPDLSEFAP